LHLAARHSQGAPDLDPCVLAEYGSAAQSAMLH
jgi:hypothetical protein